MSQILLNTWYIGLQVTYTAHLCNMSKERLQGVWSSSPWRYKNGEFAVFKKMFPDLSACFHPFPHLRLIWSIYGWMRIDVSNLYIKPKCNYLIYVGSYRSLKTDQLYQSLNFTLWHIYSIHISLKRWEAGDNNSNNTHLVGHCGHLKPCDRHSKPWKAIWSPSEGRASNDFTGLQMTIMPSKLVLLLY